MHTCIYIHVYTDSQAALYYLISWPEEGESMSVAPGEQVISPPAEELVDGCMCKVKGFKKSLAKVVASRTKAEMSRKLDGMK